MTDTVIKNACDLHEGDLVDLEGDRYADPKYDHPEFEFAYAMVMGFERETPDCVRVDFENGSFGFPPAHPLTVVVSEDAP